jgi:hypothetical protein
MKANRPVGGICRLYVQGRTISNARDRHEADSNQKFSFETLVDFQRTTWSYNPEERILPNHRRENLRSYIGTRIAS